MGSGSEYKCARPVKNRAARKVLLSFYIHTCISSIQIWRLAITPRKIRLSAGADWVLGLESGQGPFPIVPAGLWDAHAHVHPPPAASSRCAKAGAALGTLCSPTARGHGDINTQH
jgi:hypothetical protein